MMLRLHGLDGAAVLETTREHAPHVLLMQDRSKLPSTRVFVLHPFSGKTVAFYHEQYHDYVEYVGERAGDPKAECSSNAGAGRHVRHHADPHVCLHCDEALP